MRFFRKRASSQGVRWDQASDAELLHAAYPLFEVADTLLASLDALLISPGSEDAQSASEKWASLRERLGGEVPSAGELSKIQHEAHRSVRETGAWQRKEIAQLRDSLACAIRELVKELRSALQGQQNMLGDFADFQGRIAEIERCQDIQEIRKGLVSELTAARRILEWQTQAHDQLRQNYELSIRALEDQVSLIVEDPVTGLGDGNAFDVAVRTARQMGPEVPRSIALIQLDGFAALNSDHGHVAGDYILSLFARHLQITLGADCSVFRTGGATFGVVLQGFVGLLEKRVRKALDEIPEIQLRPPARGGRSSIRLQGAAGLTTVVSGEAVAETIARANRALQAAKRSGPGSLVNLEPKSQAA